jgi:ParB/RepB/Spo0J family partition protein
MKFRWQLHLNTDTRGMTTYREIPIDLVVPSDSNVRHTFDPATDEDDATLLDSMRAGSILQPIRVRPHPNKTGHFEIIAGERRYLAAKALQLDTIPAVIDEDCSELDARRQRFVENAARKNLSAYLHCKALMEYIAAERQADPGVTYAVLAERVGTSEGAIKRATSYWQSLTPDVHAAIVAAQADKVVGWTPLAQLARTKDPAAQMKACARLLRQIAAQTTSDGPPGGSEAKKRGSAAGARAKKTPPIYRRVIDVSMGDDPAAPRPPHVRLRPTRSPGRPEMRLSIGCAPSDLDPVRLPELLATLRAQTEAAIAAISATIQTSSEKSGPPSVA